MLAQSKAVHTLCAWSVGSSLNSNLTVDSSKLPRHTEVQSFEAAHQQSESMKIDQGVHVCTPWRLMLREAL